MPGEYTNPRPPGARHNKATKHDSRRSNLRTTLELVSTQGATSRAEIARQTGLTRAAVSSLVAELIEQGLLRELGQGTSAGGKPPTLLALNERGRDIVALDLGHRPFRAALVDLSGRIHERIDAGEVSPGTVPIGMAAHEVATELIESLIKRAAAPVLGIGVGTPGVVDSDGRVIEAINLDWHRLDLAGALRRRFDIPISIANDAQVAALAEFRRHPADRRNLILVKLGMGVGAGIVLNGTLHRGDHGAAGEIGHVRVMAEGEPCRCGNRGCLETVASIPAILRRLGVAADQHPWDALTLAGLVGEEPVRSALSEAGRHLGMVLASVVAMLDVGHLVIAPELRNAGDILVDQVREELNSRILPTTADLIEIEVTQLGGDLVLAGAASAVLADRLGVVLR
ncbi:MAG TPA: ROK family transcriptional regulator [Acidimicrobiia bacterium]|nr:ROK family transcriptional regulator [Acidimicrobiia bacterium]